MSVINCPYGPHDMRSIASANGDPDEIRSRLVYEVFQIGAENSFSDFLSDIDLAGLTLKAVNDTRYKTMWKNIKGAEVDRFLLYPVNDLGNRLRDLKNDEYDDGMYKQLEEFTKDKFSEIDVIFQHIEQKKDDYYFEEIHVSGYNGHTYSYDICDVMGQTLYTIRPCCPVCRTLLPDNWFSDAVQAYVPIALIGEKSSGKTTYMSSLLEKNTYKRLSMGLGRGMRARNAIVDDINRFKIQAIRYENLERLENGQYPNPTDTVMPPVFINISKNCDGKDSQMIVGIFDCPGELFDLKHHISDAELKVLCNMQSYIYFVEPKQMSELGYRFINEDIEFTPDLIKPIEEQGIIQGQNIGKSINASDIIQNVSTKEKPTNVTDMLLHLEGRLYGHDICLKHIAYTMVKSDVLLDNDYKPKVEQIKDMEKILKPDEIANVLDQSHLNSIDDIVKEFFQKVVLSRENTEENMDTFKDMGGSNVSKSWHCISVAKHIPKNERVDNKVCEFAPVRIVEPFVRCLIPKMTELGWIDWET